MTASVQIDAQQYQGGPQLGGDSDAQRLCSQRDSYALKARRWFKTSSTHHSDAGSAGDN